MANPDERIMPASCNQHSVIAEQCGGDLKAILEDADKRQAASGREIGRPKAKPQ